MVTKTPKMTDPKMTDPKITEKPNPALPSGYSGQQLVDLYKGMALIRAFDERQLKLQRSGRIGFCVVSTGEEAVQVGVAAALEKQDWIFPTYRQHGMILQRGVSVTDMANQLYGNANDRCLGRQMPVHYSFKEINYVSLSSVIGTHLSHAVGAAMAAQYKGDDAVMVTFIGDGGTSSNDFHAALTFAGVQKAPVVFYIVNNHYAISHPVEEQCAAESLHLKGVGYGIPSIKIDGNDLLAVHQATQEALNRARAGEGPTLIECDTYRMGPHSSSDDPTRYRDAAEQEAANKACPIGRFEKQLESWGLWDDTQDKALWTELEQTMVDDTNLSENVGEPTWESLFDDVYAEVPPALARQRDEFMARESQFPRENEGEFPL
ncbi:MAG: thiamine pyrophosphate-dependent dehydrogenase E1 component subunit alpha [Vampirovibrionales bacterium]|nr:thiamine pyrophosphate-dependent dehydrogenase E1 component subunit alpha [Vampirovibrionales bacterium]